MDDKVYNKKKKKLIFLLETRDEDMYIEGLHNAIKN
jgi:hypothetical protein